MGANKVIRAGKKTFKWRTTHFRLTKKPKTRKQGRNKTKKTKEYENHVTDGRNENTPKQRPPTKTKDHRKPKTHPHHRRPKSRKQQETKQWPTHNRYATKGKTQTRKKKNTQITKKTKTKQNREEHANIRKKIPRKPQYKPKETTGHPLYQQKERYQDSKETEKPKPDHTKNAKPLNRDKEEKHIQTQDKPATQRNRGAAKTHETTSVNEPQKDELKDQHDKTIPKEHDRRHGPAKKHTSRQQKQQAHKQNQTNTPRGENETVISSRHDKKTTKKRQSGRTTPEGG
ncbi:hypothetical protein ARMGADRAFT_1038690 [Armillaria gallica]|uniref:Uncharacterized protein n=1 Tax=Armillaria gallica TaxID=47427 RepID=A0A2H3CH60_ARMGA|nr:hypothetical protein ARMGADRAFT_1038690 [Armillaria gallica]